MEDLKQIEVLLDALKRVKAELKRRNKISDTLRNSGNCTIKRKQKLNTDLNWQCMEYDKAKTDFARLFENGLLDVGTEKKVYNPSSFHSYIH